jgi:hypothetical protein
MTSNSDPCELFFNMEKKFNLFAIRTLDGFPVWDIIRIEVFEKILLPELPPSIPMNYTIRIKQVIRRLYSIPKIFFTRGNIFYFGTSRIFNEKGECYDPYFHSIKDYLKNNYIFFESVLWKDKYSKHKRIFIFHSLFKFFGRHMRFYELKKSLSDNDESVILSACRETFNYINISHKDIENILWNFRIDYYFYKNIFRIKRIQKVFMFQNGIQKGLIKAAQINKIPVFEFQHGDIVNSSVGMNYGSPEFRYNEDIIFPDVIFTFSNIWCEGKFIPADCIELGSDFFYTEIAKCSEPKSVTILSSRDHERILGDLICKLAKLDTTTMFYYKLHPSQFMDLERHRKYFREYKNIQIIPIEMNIRDIVNISNNFIAVYSTAMYEILQAGKHLFVYKRDPYLLFKDYFNLARVYLFDNADDFIKLRNDALQSFSQEETTQFFKPFNINAFEDACVKYSFPYTKKHDEMEEGMRKNISIKKHLIEN